FLGYSDSTVTHLVCYQAGFSSFYGPSILAEFAENREIYPYTCEWVHKILFSNKVPLVVEKPPYWTSEYLPWIEENKNVAKQLFPHEGFQVLQGTGVVQGPLLGGCIEVLIKCIETPLWPDFTGSLLFLESSEEAPEPALYKTYLMKLAEVGVLGSVKGVLIGKPYQGLHAQSYDAILLSILRDLGLSHLVVATNLPFGHNEPMCILPYGAEARFDCTDKTFTILESGTEA
ncbi:MAG: LD-carboxypeptidase, partial [Sphaerochaetaceae bacterium]